MTYYCIIMFDPMAPKEPYCIVKTSKQIVDSIEESMTQRGFTLLHKFEFTRSTHS